ncbi:hypothetical protein VaNZ11_007898 [Volvox africanus]|uniref:Uncharacterized protein n=1 Tax=Volvox africanus TaxID=51714 RepID=A0ABQ5S3U8_9CHLO|nr:hypothetical protein VaNZ11_007898 [Volvox africanus]
MSYSDTDTKMERAGDNFARNPSFYSIFMLMPFEFGFHMLDNLWRDDLHICWSRRSGKVVAERLVGGGGKWGLRGRRQVGTPLQVAAIWHHHRGSQVAREAVGAMHINRY